MIKFDVADKAARFVTRTGVFIAASVCITLIFSFNLVLTATGEVNRSAIHREKTLLTNAINQSLDKSRYDLAKFAASKPVLNLASASPETRQMGDMLARQILSGLEFDSAYLLDGNEQVLLGEHHGQKSGQAEYEALKPLVSHLLGRTLNGGKAPLAHGESRLIHHGEAIFLASAIPVLQQDGVASVAFVALGLREIGQAGLGRLAAQQGLKEFGVTSSPVPHGEDSIELANADGETSAYFQWTAEKPGDSLFRSAMAVIVFAIIFLLLVFMWIFSNLRNAAEEMLKREEIIGKIAAYDELSGLHNRRSFDMQLSNLLARGHGSLAVLLLDLDKFKPVNDLHGHKVGDDLIRAVARRLREIVRGSECVARLGGDEFAIIQTDITKPSDAAKMGQRILDKLREPFVLNDIEVSIGVSIGIALSPTDTADKDALIRMADTALYQAKNEGRNRFCFFEREMDRSMQMSRIVADDLRNAIENDELVLHYQPQISSDGLKILGVEALVRWNHPVHGMIPPNDFISIAEQRGLIMPLSQWVLRRACYDMLPWPELRLAVNISPIDFRNADFVENVSKVLTETGFDPTRLELELTEGVVVEDADAAEQAMMELRGLGVGLALDDFGTGYSSLIYLRRFAFDKIKIDRSFLEYMETTGESAVLVHSVVHLGRALGLRVCAEGVETAEQHRFLQAVGCHELQGYFFSRPLPLAALEAFIAARSGPEIKAA